MSLRFLNVLVETEDHDEREALKRFLLRGIASERSEANRLNLRVSLGYGDATTRDSMDTEEGAARLRLRMGQRLADAVAAAIDENRD